MKKPKFAARPPRPGRGNKTRWTTELLATRAGQAYVDYQAERLYLERDQLNRALPGDLVELELSGRAPGGPKAQVHRIVERRLNPILGVISRRRGLLEFRPFRANTADRYTLDDVEGLSAGDQVAVVRVPPVRRGEDERVRVVERFGRADEARHDSLMIALEKGLSQDFPPSVEDEAAEAAVPPSGLPKGRMDLRALLTVTIDPPDAKDHDDALSLVRSGNGFELGIHIADVSAYVRQGSALDEEARRRGNSCYLPDMVLPMLPPSLSGDVCSLKPGVDRLALSVLVKLDAGFKIGRHRVVASLICSDHRLSYEQAERMLHGQDEGPADLVELLSDLWKITSQFREQRFQKGALELEVPETRARLDGQGEVLEIVRYAQRDSNRLVEECMILANRLVGLDAAERNFAFLYRVHEKPLEARLAEFEKLAGALGFKLPERRANQDDWLRQIGSAKGSEVRRKLIHSLLLRSLAKARYSAEDLGHYGLALTRYAHFTSPIRRYPDLVNHRQVHRWLDGEASEAPEDLEQIGQECSETEVKAAEAEREAIQVKCVRYMLPRVGESFQAMVTGMIRSGFFVELLDFPVEGMIRLASLHDDYYVWDPDRGRIWGRRNGASVTLGDTLEVTLVRGDLETRQLEFEPSAPLAGARKSTPKPAERERPGRRRRP